MDKNRAKHKAEELKGRAKQAVGDMTDNRDLKREGKADEFRGKTKQRIDDVKDKAHDVVERVGDRIDGAMD